jgi:hypothetical protein
MELANQRPARIRGPTRRPHLHLHRPIRRDLHLPMHPPRPKRNGRTDHRHLADLHSQIVVRPTARGQPATFPPRSPSHARSLAHRRQPALCSSGPRSKPSCCGCSVARRDRPGAGARTAVGPTSAGSDLDQVELPGQAQDAGRYPTRIAEHASAVKIGSLPRRANQDADTAERHRRSDAGRVRRANTAQSPEHLRHPADGNNLARING